MIASIISGCMNELSDIAKDGDLITVNLSLAGEVSVNEVPLTKNGESIALLGIQVYQNGNPYAWGLFDSVEGISINLHSGAEYSAICQYIKNGKETLHFFEQSTDAKTKTYLLKDHDTYKKTGGSASHQVTYQVSYWKSMSTGPDLASYGGYYHNFHKTNSGYSVPFDIVDHYDIRTRSTDLWCSDYYKKTSSHYETAYSYVTFTADNTHTVNSITNSFVYDNVNVLNVTSSGVAKSQSTSADIDRYYGEISPFTASSESNKTILFDMKHLVYGIQCNVTGVSDGTASITIINGNTVLLAKSGISSDYHSEELMFAFSDMHGAWEYADNYTENVTVSMTWLRGVGVLQDLGSQVIQVKRNCKNVISVSLGTD